MSTIDIEQLCHKHDWSDVLRSVNFWVRNCVDPTSVRVRLHAHDSRNSLPSNIHSSVCIYVCRFVHKEMHESGGWKRPEEGFAYFPCIHFFIHKGLKVTLVTPKSPRSFEIWTWNLREVLGLCQTKTQPGSEFDERHQGQAGGQHWPV